MGTVSGSSVVMSHLLYEDYKVIIWGAEHRKLTLSQVCFVMI